ncbi:MAG: PaaI family thioesterase [Vicinamibacterales bacterium]
MTPQTSPSMLDAVRDSFARQGLMATLGACLVSVEPGQVRIELPFSPAVTQQHGYFHAAATTAIADTAGGYAALTLMRPGEEVLAVEFKLNLLRPAVGERLVATAQVLKPGRTLTVSRIDVHAHRGGQAVLVATMTQTNFRVAPPAAPGDPSPPS